MYLLGLAILYPVVYGVMVLGIPRVFGVRASISYERLAASAAIISILYLGVFAFSTMLKDPEVSNWILHTWAGGFLAATTYFFAIRDSNFRSTTLQFIVFGFLVVTMLGVANELIEFFLQSRFNFVFAESIDDTWIDLTNNTIGSAVALTALALFAERPK